jgi:heme oxygenase (biliverdin-IX-beta and delta-forming)
VEPSIFLQQLRAKTAGSHQLIEQNIASQQLMGPGVTLLQYGHYLKNLYGFVQGFEKMVFPLLNHYPLLQLDNRKKLHLLQADLAMLNDTDELQLLPDELFSTHYGSIPAALGGMYVLEGSTLGGQIISKHLLNTLGNAAAGSTTYFTAYAGQTGSMWKNFLQLLCEAAVTTEGEEEIIESAINTFTLLNTSLLKSHYKIAVNEY